MIGLGILGCRTHHAIAIAEAAGASTTCEIVAVAEASDLQGARSFIEKESLGECRAFESYEALLSDPAVHAVYVGVPTSSRFAWCLSAAQKSKHLLVEKPVSVDADEVERLHAVCRDRSVAFVDAVSFVHHPRTRRIVEDLRHQRVFGVPVRCSVALSFEFPQDHLGRLRDPAAAGNDPLGCIGDFGWFCARWGILTFGPDARASSVRCCDASFVGKIPVDVTAVVLFGDMSCLQLHCSYRHTFRQTLEITGSRRKILRCSDFRIPRHGPRCASDYEVETFGCVSDIDTLVVATKQTVLTQAADQRVCMLDTFVAACHDPSKHAVWARAALHTQIIVSALMESARKLGAGGGSSEVVIDTNNNTTASKNKRQRKSSS